MARDDEHKTIDGQNAAGTEGQNAVGAEEQNVVGTEDTVRSLMIQQPRRLSAGSSFFRNRKDF